METRNVAFLSDDWYIDGETAWFLYSNVGALLKYNFVTGKCEFVSIIPNEENCSFRQYIKCIKTGDDIIVLPDYGHFILFYSLKKDCWAKVEIETSKKSRLACWNYIKKGEKIYILSNGIKKVIELDIKEKKIMKYYDVSKALDDYFGSVVMTSDSFYIVSSAYLTVYIFNCLSKEVSLFNIPTNLEDNFRTICYDNKLLWLSGRKKKIYKCNTETKQLDIFEEFPNDFGIYNFANKFDHIIECELERYDVPLFIESVKLDKKVWFIPFQTNKILFLDTVTNKLNEFVILDEEETETSLKNNILGHKYLVEYIRENRYIGLYSLKNEYMIEIDSDKLNYRIVPFDFDNSCIEIFENKIFTEVRKMDTIIYTEIIRDFQCNKMGKNEKIGSKIYFSINSSK